MHTDLSSGNISQYLKNGKVPKLISSYYINEDHSHHYARLSHAHENILELYYAHSGQASYNVNGKRYLIKKGDFVICNSGVLHGDEPFEMRHLQSYCCAFTSVAFEGLPENYLTTPEDVPIVSCGSLADKIGNIMELIHLLSPDQERMGETCNCLANSILLFVYQLVKRRAKSLEHQKGRNPDLLAQHIKKYLNEHYTESISLQTVADALRMNSFYLSHLFKKEMGVSPMQYVMRRRIGEAQTLLMDTLIPVADIADSLGYNSPSHFNAIFTKHVGMSPGKYRRSFFEMDPVENQQTK